MRARISSVLSLEQSSTTASSISLRGQASTLRAARSMVWARLYVGITTASRAESEPDNEFPPPRHGKASGDVDHHYRGTEVNVQGREVMPARRVRPVVDK